MCGTIAKEAVKIRVHTEKKSFGKLATIIDGVTEDADPKALTKRLKTKLACGGTYKDGRIELQGNHKHKIKELLKDAGFAEEQIEVA